MILTTLQFIIFVSYITFLLVRFKKPLPSISESWYQLPDGLNNLFTAFTFLLGVTMVLQTSSDTPWFLISGAGLIFVGGAMQFKNTSIHTNIIHFGGVMAGILGALIGLWADFGLYAPLVGWLLSVGVMKLLRINNFIWWAEITAFLSILIGLYTK